MPLLTGGQQTGRGSGCVWSRHNHRLSRKAYSLSSGRYRAGFDAERHLTGTLEQIDQGQQQLSIGPTELLDHRGRFACRARHNLIPFLHGGGLLSDSSLATGILTKPAPPPPLNLQLWMGYPLLGYCQFREDRRIMPNSRVECGVPPRRGRWGKLHAWSRHNRGSGMLAQVVYLKMGYLAPLPPTPLRDGEQSEPPG